MKRNSGQGYDATSSAAAPANRSLPALVKRYRWPLIWCAFHTCALFLSYNEVHYFNSTGEPRTDKFWPFVKFTFPYFLPDDNTTYFKFNGFFTEYDWTEFSFYVGSVLFFILLIYVYKKSE